MLLLAPPITPVVVKVVGAPTKEVGVVDILLSSLGIIGLILVGSLLLGLGLGALFIWFKHRVPDNPFNGEPEKISHLDLGPVTRTAGPSTDREAVTPSR